MINTTAYAASNTGTWKQNSKGWWYEFSDKSYAKNEFLTIKEKTYYFNQYGYMKTGWLKYNNNWYYFDPTNGYMKTGWQKISNKWYFFNISGIMITGWKKLNNNWYYFTTDGYMKTGWLQLKSKWYYFNSEGIMQTGWLSKGNKWYFLNNDGSLYIGTKKDNDITCTFNSDGVLTKATTNSTNKWNLTGMDLVYMKWVIQNTITSNMSRSDKVQAIHDWVVSNTQYDTTYKQHDAHSTLNDHLAVCSGYAYLFNAYMDLLNIPCEYITGYADNGDGNPGSHAWNAVKLDDDYWYFIDCTFDDPFVNGTSDHIDGSNISYEYFLLSAKSMNKSHIQVNKVNPEGTSDKYNEQYIKKLINKRLEEYKIKYEKDGYIACIITSTNELTKFINNSKVKTNYAIIVDKTKISLDTISKTIKNTSHGYSWTSMISNNIIVVTYTLK